MVHAVYVVYYDPFWLYAAAFFAIVCALSIGLWCKWSIEYLLSRRRWMKAMRKMRLYWYYLIGFGFAAAVSVGLYIFQH